MPKLLPPKLAQDTGSPTSRYGLLMKEAQENRAATDNKKWTPTNVARQVIKCRTSCKGIPTFRPRFAGKQYEVHGKPAVLLNCTRGLNGCPGTFFTEVPEEAIKTMNSDDTIGNWKHFLKKWDQEDALPEKLRMRIGEALWTEPPQNRLKR